MSDYLGHLVERSFAPIPAVRPNTPSRFEPSPAKSAVDSATEIDLPIDTKNTTSPQQPAELPEINASRIPNAARETNHDTQGPFAVRPFAGVRKKHSPEMLAPFSPFTAMPPVSQNSSPMPRHADDLVRSVATVPRNIQPVDAAPPSTQGINAGRRDGSRPVSPVARKETGQSSSRETSTPPPTIHVTIGRVEIKATPPPPTPSHASPIKNPAMSLENYLQRRSNGGRDE